MNIPSAPAVRGHQHRLFVDVMLGTLARWLRILGYDTRYENRIEHDELIRQCVQEDRVALTRDTRLAKRKPLKNCLFIEGNTLGEQLAEVIGFTKDSISLDLILSRCLECNTLVQKVKKQTIKAGVPPYVYQTQEEFGYCPDCHRIYWSGTHKEHILEHLKNLIGDLAEKPVHQSVTKAIAE